MTFNPNRAFRKKYRKIFKKDPLAANTFLLLAEIADERGEVVISDEDKLADLLMARFEDPRRWAL